MPGNSQYGRARRRACASSRLLIVPSWRFISGRGGQSSGGGTSGRSAHWPSSGSGRCAERAEHREDLGVADVRDDARLADLVAAHDLDHVELEHRRRPRVREVLRGRPDARPAGDLLHHLDRGAEPAAAEQSAPFPDVSPGTIGIRHWFGSSVRSSPKNVSASIAGDATEPASPPAQPA